MLRRPIGIGLAACALAFAACGDDDDDERADAGAGTTQEEAAEPVGQAQPPAPVDTAPDGATLAAPKVNDLKKAAAAAGCTFESFADEGQDHVEDELTAAAYKTNPPTSGPHNPTWAQDGYYAPDNTPDLKFTVHALEHGRITLQYREDVPEAQQALLRGLMNEDIAGAGAGYHMLMFKNNSGMKPAVAAVAWRNSLTCDTVDAKVIDAMRAFYRERLDKAPEQVP